MSSLKRKSPFQVRKDKELDTANSKLLHLPESDLTRSTRPNLVLMAMPPAKSKEGEYVMQAMKEGKCSILTNHQSSALVLPDSSYTLTTIGTSNSLVVYQPTNEETSSKDDTISATDNNGDASDAKKPKVDDRQACRLIQPGGSGSSFLSLSKNQITPENVEGLLKPEEKAKEQPCHTALDMSLALQCSVPEVEVALESLPGSTLPSSDSNPTSSRKYRLWTDEEYWNAKRALVEMLCEEVDAEDEDIAPEQFAELVAQRIVLPDDADDSLTGENATQWKLAVAKQMIRLGTNIKGDRRYWDRQKISKWALQDLVLTSRRSTWPLEELLSTWQSRLPLLWCNDRIPKRQEESEESEPVDDDNDTSLGKDVATRQALEAMEEVEILIPESDGKKNTKDTDEDKEMVELKF